MPSRLEACIACYGSGTLPSRSNRRLFRLLSGLQARQRVEQKRLFRLLTSRPTELKVSAALSGPSASGVEGQNSVSHVSIEKGIGLLVELACSHSSVLSEASEESRVIHWSA